MKGFFLCGLLVGPMCFSQDFSSDSATVQQIESINFTQRLPVTKEVISVSKDLDFKNLGQDLPVLLKNQTSVVTTSDAGNGVGYTGFRIRGVGGTSINVMMNGVPYNDSESQGTFFVDVPDLTSSASQIVIQRGVGTSTNGVSAFGASVNVISKNPDKDFYLKTDNSYGSFNTYKYSAEIGSGKFWNDRVSLMARYTKIHSDGYINRAFSNLDSYNFSALFEQDKTKIRLLAFGGKEKTYQAWNGIDKATWEVNPRFNYSGAIYNDDWSEIIGFYDNETDNYRQNHFQLLWQQSINNQWNMETTAHYTRGKGYYENYKQGDPFSRYRLSNFGNQEYSDFIRKKWLDNDFYGLVSTLYGKLEDVDLSLGLVANQYFGRHYGDVSGVYFPEIDQHEYYRNTGLKNEISGFAKAIFKINRFELFGDLQLRNISYDTKILLAGDGEGTQLSKQWTFFNPKAGISYLIPQGKIFVSYANAHREPNRDDLIANPETEAETLHDFEAGLEKRLGKINLAANLYYMNYVNQLVLSGKINNIGEFIRENSGKSYRLGFEIAAESKVTDWLQLTANASFSSNRNKDFKIETQNGITELNDTPISFSPDFIGNLSGRFFVSDSFSLGLQNQYVGSQFLDNTNSENLRLDSYSLTDFNAQYSLKLRRTNVNFKFLLNNIFNKKFVNNGYVYEGAPYYFSQAGTNFMFGISILFK